MKNSAENTPIKLLKIGTLDDGTIRLQSQLYLGKDTADFIMSDETLKCWGNGNIGFDFYEYKKPYIIVNNINEMKRQKL